MSRKSSTSRDRRPLGVSSRLHRLDVPTTPWRAGNGEVIELPVLVDYVVADEEGVQVRIEATVSAGRVRPVIMSISLTAREGLDTDVLQREFRWRTPIDIVERLVPRLLAEGIDPFGIDLPVTGFPEIASGGRRRGTALSDDFLRDIAEEYLRLGRGYAKRMAMERQVSPRTVVSWVVKARERGILSAAPGPGSWGGELVDAHRLRGAKDR